MKFLLLILIFFSQVAFADFDNSQFNFGLGMVNVSFTENESGLPPKTGSAADSQTSPATGSVSTIGGFVEKEQYFSSRMSYNGKLFFPLMPSSTGTYIFGGGGLNYYFNSLSTIGSFKSPGTQILFIPKWRFHAGGNLGAGYLVYNTLTSKKSDTLIELSALVGTTYNRNTKWSYRAELSFGRGIGFNSSTMAMKALFGMSYNLE